MIASAALSGRPGETHCSFSSRVLFRLRGFKLFRPLPVPVLQPEINRSTCSHLSGLGPRLSSVSYAPLNELPFGHLSVMVRQRPVNLLSSLKKDPRFSLLDYSIPHPAPRRGIFLRIVLTRARIVFKISPPHYEHYQSVKNRIS